MKKRIAIILLMMLLVVGVCNASAENALHLQNVVFQEDGTVDLIVAVPRAENLQPTDFTVVANKEVIAAESVASLGRSDIATRWVFVIDLSMSYDIFEKAKSALVELINLLPEKDMAAVITTKMTTSELQWTNNKEELKAQANLKRDYSATALNATVADAVVMLENHSTTFERTCVVIMSNGENSDVAGMTQNELVTTIANSHVAVYTYAFKDEEPNTSKISNFGAYARASAGGAEIIVERRELDALANAKKVEQNEQHFRIVKLSNAGLPQEISSFTVSLQDGTLLLTDDFQLSTVRQLAYEEWLNAYREEHTAVTPEPMPSSTVISTADPEETSAAIITNKDSMHGFLKIVEKNLLPILGGVLVILIVVLILLKRKKPVDAEVIAEPEAEVKPENHVDVEEDSVTVIDTDSTKLLINLTRTDDSSVHSVTMNDTLIIGRKKPEADLVIAGDDKLSRAHARISLVKGTIIIENLGSNGTYVNGKKIDRPVQLHQQDVLKMGEKYYQISWRMQ